VFLTWLHCLLSVYVAKYVDTSQFMCYTPWSSVLLEKLTSKLCR